MSQNLGILKSRRFLPLFVTQFLGAFNDNLFKNAFIILVTFSLAQASGVNAWHASFLQLCAQVGHRGGRRAGARRCARKSQHLSAVE